MLVADDFHLETSGAEYRSGLVTFSLSYVRLLVYNCHGRKLQVETTLTWVGFELLRESYRLGISRLRAEWFCRWCEESANADALNTSSSEEGLGSITYVAGAL